MAQKSAKTSSANEVLEQPTPIEAPQAAAGIDPLLEQIALAAYFRAEARGFAPGNEMQDWLEAEQEVRSASAPKH